MSRQGISMVRHSLAAEPIKQGNLIRLFKGMENSVLEVEQQHFICGPEHHFQRPKVKAFCEWLVEQTRELHQEHDIAM